MVALVQRAALCCTQSATRVSAAAQRTAAAPPTHALAGWLATSTPHLPLGCAPAASRACHLPNLSTRCFFQGQTSPSAAAEMQQVSQLRGSTVRGSSTAARQWVSLVCAHGDAPAGLVGVVCAACGGAAQQDTAAGPAAWLHAHNHNSSTHNQVERHGGRRLAAAPARGGGACV